MAGRSVLITGASTGIGEACARHLAAREWQVFAGVRKVDDGERLRASSPRIEPLTLDVTSASDLTAAVELVRERTGGTLDGLVNNAGVAVGGPIEYVTADEWRHQFEVNVIGPVELTRACLPLLRAARPAGRVVMIGSIGGRMASPLLGPYSASKHAMEAIAETLRHELRGDGIKVALIEPGAIRTPMWEKGRQTADELEHRLPPEALDRYRKTIDGVRKSIDMQERNAVPPEKVAAAVERALGSKHPHARTLVGPDAKVMGAVTRVLPDSARDALLRLASRT